MIGAVIAGLLLLAVVTFVSLATLAAINKDASSNRTVLLAVGAVDGAIALVILSALLMLATHQN